jgi:hypothetical protein
MSRKTVVATMPASTDHVDTVGPKRRRRQVADRASDGGLQPDDLMAIQRKVDAIAAARSTAYRRSPERRRRRRHCARQSSRPPPDVWLAAPRAHLTPWNRVPGPEIRNGNP